MKSWGTKWNFLRPREEAHVHKVLCLLHRRVCPGSDPQEREVLRDKAPGGVMGW